jgi:hypothetical protein
VKAATQGWRTQAPLARLEPLPGGNAAWRRWRLRQCGGGGRRVRGAAAGKRKKQGKEKERAEGGGRRAGAASGTRGWEEADPPSGRRTGMR